MNWHSHPLLCLYRTPTQPLRRYLSELLLQEGYLCGDTVELDGRDVSGELDGRALAFVSAETLTTAECKSIAVWVQRGGNAVLVRPPQDLIDALGLRWSEAIHEVYHSAPPGYAHLSDHPWTSHHAGAVVQSLTPTSLRHVEDERAIAFVAMRRDEASTYPAIIELTVGKGRVTIFWVDPGHNGVLLRQGDPNNASNGLLGDPKDATRFKAGALFERLLDVHLRDFPQADVWADLLVSIIRHTTDATLPLPRAWLFPDNAPALTLLDGDSDIYDWEMYENLIEPCVKRGVPYTLNLMPEHVAKIDRAKVDHWLGRGQDFQLHYWPGTLTPTVVEEATTLAEHSALFREKLGIPAVGGRAHCVLWPGYTEMAELLAANGHRIETNFMGFRGYQFGYLSTARPGRFMRSDGRVIPLMQQPTIFMDDPMRGEKSLLPARSPEKTYAIVRKFYEESARKYHGVICTCLHPVPPSMEFYLSVQNAIRSALLDATEELGLAAVTTRGWSAFCEARRDLDFRFANGSWRVTAAGAISQLTVLDPSAEGERRAGLPWRTMTMNLAAGESAALAAPRGAVVGTRS